MRRLLINLFCLLVPVSFFAQELSENLESYQVTVVGDQILLTGFKAMSKDPVFEVYLCDKNLVVQKSYSKATPVSTKDWYTAKNGDLFVFIFYGTGSKEKYRIALDANLIEKYAGAPDEKARKAAEADKNLFVATDWTYDGSYGNDYIVGDLLLDAQMSGITCYSVLDPVQGTYKTKWEKDFSSATYIKMEILGVQDRTAYILAVQSIPENTQKFLAINIDDGTILFSTELNESDSLDAVSVSTFLIKGDVIYLGGTYVAADPGESYAPVYDNYQDNEKRGYDDLAPYVLAPADGYYVMTIDSKKGSILKMKTFGFPDIDKTVDYRDYRLAICHGITPLANGKMLAFFELISSPHQRGINPGGGFMNTGTTNGSV
ncbi:MAG TPA: hypothetical protein VFJ43_11455, partial [Bacteroidia bacterium]|nr:hypothetical protein [Bacteroidia bacterium]